MRPCFLPRTARPGKKRMAEGEQEVYVRSARTKVGASGRAKEKRAGCGPEKSSSLRGTHARVHMCA